MLQRRLHSSKKKKFHYFTEKTKESPFLPYYILIFTDLLHEILNLALYGHVARYETLYKNRQQKKKKKEKYQNGLHYLLDFLFNLYKKPLLLRYNVHFMTITNLK